MACILHCLKKKTKLKLHYMTLGARGDAGAFFLFSCGIFLFLYSNHYPHMKRTETLLSPEGYVAPSLRIIETKQERAFLASNLEPIDGDDDPEIDW